MRTVEWIDKHKGVNDGNTKIFGNVAKGADGTIYSYGYHYPLLFKLNDVYFVNHRGYSVTTSKHINWAHQATDYKAYNIEVPRLHHGPVEVAQAMSWLEKDIIDLIYQMAGKRRQDTSVYLNLQRNLKDTIKALNTLKGNRLAL